MAAVLLFLVGVTLASCYVQTPARRTVEGWRRALVPYLLVETIILFAFALLWWRAGTQQSTMQIVLLSIASFGMGLQGALVGAFEILDGNTVAITGTWLLLGILRPSLTRFAS